MATPVLLAFSGGKDSVLALAALAADPNTEVVALITTLTADCDRIAMHGVRRELLELQAEAIGLPLEKVLLPRNATNAVYEAQMAAALSRWRDDGVHCVAFGDLYLADVRAYRERQITALGMQPLFPLWQLPTDMLARRFIAEGYRAVLTCVDPRQVDASLAGRWYDEQLLADLPATADPCGENGEFHTFVSDGPIFNHPLEVAKGELVEREGFCFCDLLPASQVC